MRTISQMAEHERPREKLKSQGVRALSDQELMAVVLGSGVNGHDVLKVARRVVEMIDAAGRPVVDDLRQIPGVGFARAGLIAAALEFARRRIRSDGIRIAFPPDVVPLIQHYADRRQEHFLCVSLNGAQEVLATRVVTIGLVDRSHVHPREVFAEPITDRASAVIVAHNHPAGGLNPSTDDLVVTGRLKAAGETLGIRLLDHIIFNRGGYYSLLEHNEL